MTDYELKVPGQLRERARKSGRRAGGVEAKGQRRGADQPYSHRVTPGRLRPACRFAVILASLTASAVPSE